MSGFSLCCFGLAASFLVADTPVRPSRVSFPSKKSVDAEPAKPADVKPAAVKTVEPKVEPVVRQAAQVVEEIKLSDHDYHVKAASVEVAWLQDAMTYGLRLRANARPEEKMIVLSGFIPTDRLREKALTLARQTAGNIPVADQMVLQPHMVLSHEAATDPEQVFLIQVELEKVMPGISKTLQVSLNSQGVALVSGRVDEFEDRRKIIRALQAIPGCTAVKYDLKVFATQVLLPAVAVSVPDQAPTVTLSPVTSSTEKKAPAKLEKQLLPVPPVVQPDKLQKPPVPAIPVVKAEPPRNETAPLAVAVIQAGVCTVKKPPEVSLSGLIPPGMMGWTSTVSEPVVLLGAPVIVQTGYSINLDVMQSTTPVGKKTITRPIEVGLPATTIVPVSVETSRQVPDQIHVMPRLADK
ncbi:MAG: BON domain-containing protein [Planctomycetia bacterium]|nr:BON domain-containing protein [Planctomycetia bacterium]